MSRTALSALEREESKPRLATAERLAEILDTPAGALFPDTMQTQKRHQADVLVDLRTLKSISTALPADADGLKARVAHLIESAGESALPLRRCRLLAGWSQSALAARAQMSQQGLSALENGRSKPRLATAEKLAGILELPVAEIFPGSGSTTRPPTTVTVDGGTLKAIQGALPPAVEGLKTAVAHLIESTEPAACCSRGEVSSADGGIA